MPTDPGQTFLALHRAERGFLMPNAWDAGSAVVLAGEGFAALGTTSAGIAFAHALPDYALGDGRWALTREQNLASLRAVAAAVTVPVNADLEQGYGDTPAEVAETVRLAVAAGAAGANIEDVPRGAGSLRDEDDAVARIAAARAAADACGRQFVLTARTDAVMLGGDDGLAVAIRRGRRFLAAGADCIFTPGVTDGDRARALVDALRAPINLVVGLNEAGSSARALLDAGVQRVSVGGSIARAALGLVQRAARELMAEGSVRYATGQLPQSALNALFIAVAERRATASETLGAGALSAGAAAGDRTG